MSGYTVAENRFGTDSISLPDTWDEYSLEAPKDDMVMSKNIKGDTISVYRNEDPSKDTWQLGPYSYSGQNAHWNFRNWGNRSLNPKLFDIIVEEIRAIQFSRWMIYPKVREPASCRPTTAKNLARLAYSKGVGIFELLSHTKYEKSLIKWYTNYKYLSQTQIINLLWEIALTSDVGPLLALTIDHEKILSIKGTLESYREKDNNEVRLRANQHLVIPTKIYAASIHGIEQKLDAFYPIAGSLVELYRERKSKLTHSEWLYFGATPSKIKHASNSPTNQKRIQSWEQVIERFGLTEFCQDGGVENWDQLRSYIMHHIRLMRLWILIFSGMRKSEVSRLPSNTFQTIKVNGGNACVLKGYTNKTLGGSAIDPTNWITSEITKKAVDAAQEMSRIACIEHGLPEYLVGTANFPLFPSWNNFAAEDDVKHDYATASLIKSDYDTEFAWLKKIPEAVVNEEDIRELKDINRYSNLERHRIEIHKPWNFTAHQFRRSIAVYAAASGRVSLGTLKYQFQHLTKEMALYYQSGSLFAKSMLKGDGAETKSLLALVAEISEERVLAQASLWEEIVIDAEEPLIGGEGHRIQVHKENGKPILIATDRATVEKAIREGRLAMKAGPIMYCTKVGPCDKAGLQLLPECPSCTNSIGVKSTVIKKAEKAITRLEMSRETFPINSPFYDQMNNEIIAVRKYIDKLKK